MSCIGFAAPVSSTQAPSGFTLQIQLKVAPCTSFKTSLNVAPTHTTPLPLPLRKLFLGLWDSSPMAPLPSNRFCRVPPHRSPVCNLNLLALRLSSTDVSTPPSILNLESLAVFWPSMFLCPTLNGDNDAWALSQNPPEVLPIANTIKSSTEFPVVLSCTQNTQIHPHLNNSPIHISRVQSTFDYVEPNPLYLVYPKQAHPQTQSYSDC
ncbi:hypothetical protein BDM02DRAFT_3192580 [Thelephora ganbajun]|uniref:Uncharacterized protein n=1 Tax=Thelephora ganbajun TaxID=370292 RepID=A0ACB6Z070_THEGA|nr:hypothetical protein BDM02DRAFT_3192580 [Thelephora ganbajun]